MARLPNSKCWLNFGDIDWINTSRVIDTRQRLRAVNETQALTDVLRTNCHTRYRSQWWSEPTAKAHKTFDAPASIFSARSMSSCIRIAAIALGDILLPPAHSSDVIPVTHWGLEIEVKTETGGVVLVERIGGWERCKSPLAGHEGFPLFSSLRIASPNIITHGWSSSSSSSSSRFSVYLQIGQQTLHLKDITVSNSCKTV